MFSAYLLSLSLLLVLVSSNFNGVWTLDKGASDSAYDLLVTIGLSSFRSSIAARLDVTDTYTVGLQSMRIRRVTSYSDDTQVFHYDKLEEGNDRILGRGKHITVMNWPIANRLIYNFTRRDGALYHSLKELIEPNLMRYSILFIDSPSKSDRRIACTQIFRKRQ